ncbi:hypothetical protein DSECCO2_436100 [anaerobic digester metagenome]
MHVRDRPEGLGVQHVLLADVHAAGEGQDAVDHQDFAVVAHVHVQIRREEGRGDEQGRGDALLAQQSRSQGPGVFFAHPVDEDAHLDAARPGPRQGFDERAPRGVRVENIGRQVDTFFGGLDGLQHERVRLVAVDEGLHAVAAGKFRFQDVAAYAFQALKRPEQGGRVDDGEVLQGRRGMFFVREGVDLAAHARGAAADAVHPEQDVEDGAGQGKGQADTDPAQGRAGVALVQQGVPGGAQGKDGQQDEPDPVQHGHGLTTLVRGPVRVAASGAPVRARFGLRRCGAFQRVPQAGVEDVEDGPVQVRLLPVGQEGGIEGLGHGRDLVVGLLQPLTV